MRIAASMVGSVMIKFSSLRSLIPPLYVVANCAAVPIIFVTAVAFTSNVVAALIAFSAPAVTDGSPTVIV